MRRVVAVGLVVLTIILIFGDVLLALNATKGDTYSEIIRDAGYCVAFLPWSLGGIMGHWFWSGERRTDLWTRLAVVMSVVILETANVLFGLTYPFVSLCVGVVCGRLVWSTERENSK